MSTTSTSKAPSCRRITASDWVAACAATSTRPGSDSRSTSRRVRTAESSIRRTLRSEAGALLISEGCTCTEAHRLLQQVVLDGVVGDVSVGFHAHLLQYPGPVGADGLH